MKSDYDAITLLSQRKDVADSWTSMATSANCKAQETIISNAVIYTAKIDFEKNLISCQPINNFYNLESQINDWETVQKQGSSQGGISIVSSALPRFTSEQMAKLRLCDNSLIELFKKAINGFGTEGLGGAGVSETCRECNQVYVIFTYCSADRASRLGFNYVDAQTGKVYQ